MLRLLSQMILTTIGKSVGKACLCTEPPSLKKIGRGGGSVHRLWEGLLFFTTFFPSYLPPPPGPVLSETLKFVRVTVLLYPNTE